MARRERAASDRRAWVARGGARAAQRLRGLDPAADPSARPAAGAVLAALQPAAQGELGFATAPEAAELWIALHLPALVVEAVASPPPPSGRALVVFDGEAALPRVLAVDAAARESQARGDVFAFEVGKFLRKGVEVHAQSNLHAKVVVFGKTAVIGSTNVSSTPSIQQI